MTQQSALPRLEQLADILGMSHLNRVARRFSGEKGLSSKASSLDALKKALSSPSRLDALIRQLHPTELQLLGEVQRGGAGDGGPVDGWALYAFARLRGLSAPPVKFSASSASLFGGYRGAEFAGADLIWTLFADGLLIPAAIPNAWLHNTYSYYQHQLGADLASSWVIADPRLLSRLPPVPVARPTFTVASAPAPASSEADSRASSALVALQLLEVCRGLSRLGGLAVTQSGTYNKPALGRLNALLPALVDAGEWVTLAQHLGVAQLDATGKRIQATAQRVRALGSGGPEALVSRLAALLGSLSRPEDRQYRLPSAGALRVCLIQLLRDLPHATTEREVQRVMEELLPAELRTQVTDYRRQIDPAAWTAWLAATLRGTLSEFGVVTVAGSAPSAVITPSAALRSAPADERPPEDPLTATNHVPTSPAWILQPNFELLVYPAQMLAHHFRILSAAQAVRFDRQTATYRLTRDSVHAALESGLSLDDLLSGLQAGSATPLSANVGTTLRDWAARRERVTLRQGVTLLEYPTRSERDAAVLRAGGRAVGDHLILLEPGQLVSPHALTLSYDQAPNKVLKFSDDGSFSLTGPLDFLLRHLLEGRVDGGPQHYTVRPTPPGRLPQTFLVELEARSSGRLPATLRLQLGVWSGVLAPPSVAAVTLIQHAQAQTLAQHPSLKNLIGTVLSPTLFTVQPGKEAAFQAALSTLGLSPTHEIMAAPNVADDLVMLTDTRKKREYLEDAIRNGYSLLLQYNEEKYVSSGWHSRVTPGRRHLDEVQPLRIDRQGPTPYLEAQTLSTGKDLRIRVQYILGLAIR